MGGELLRLSDTPLHEERAWKSGDITVLTASVTLPRCEGKSRRARRVNRYYRRYARAYLRYCEAELLPRAAETMRAAQERSAPWTCAHAALGYTVTLCCGGVLSLYTEGREEHLPPRLVLRRADTWDLRGGLLLSAWDFFPPKAPLRRQLAAAARETAAQQTDAGTAAYYPGCRALLRCALNLRNFYLASDGLHWFYPMYTVAPAAEGIVDFSLPYGETGPFPPPEEE